jgi:transposase-like protein
MTLMTVNNHNEQGKDRRSQSRWSAGKKTEAVLRLLRGEPLEELSRELKVEAHRLAAWRDDFLARASRASRVSGPTGRQTIGRSSRPSASWPADHGE